MSPLDRPHQSLSPPGTLVISIDLEMLWGVWDSPARAGDEAVGNHEREICRRLVALFETYDIRVTWAIVGRLMDDTPGFAGLRATPDCWYAPDIVSGITASEVKHDLGSHGYAHLYFNATSRQALEDDLHRAKLAQECRGLGMTSFVFPRNHVAHLDLLAKAGVKVYRSMDQGPRAMAQHQGPRFQSAVNILEKALALPVRIVQPIPRDHGLVELPSSLLLLGRGGFRRIVPAASMRKKMKGGLTRAIQQGGIFHLWFHPSNFYEERETQFGLLEDMLAEAVRLRALGDLRVRTMSEYARGPE